MLNDSKPEAARVWKEASKKRVKRKKTSQHWGFNVIKKLMVKVNQAN